MTVCRANKRSKSTQQKNLKRKKIGTDDEESEIGDSKRIRQNKTSKSTKRQKIIDNEEFDISKDHTNKPDQIEKSKERKTKNISNKKIPERKLKISFLEMSSSYSDENNYPKNNISINKEDHFSFYHLSDYRIPNKNIFNSSLKPLNLKIIENISHPKFNEEIADAEIRLFPNQFDRFFEIVTNHLRTKSDDHKLCMKLLITVDSILYYDQAFDSLIESGFIDFLPFNSAKLIVLSFKILKLLFMFRPIHFQEDFLETMKRFIYIFPAEMSLSLLIIYAHSFEFIENPWPILDFLIKNTKNFFKRNLNDEKEQNSRISKQKIIKYFNADPGVEADFVIDDIDASYLSLLLFLNKNFMIYRKNRLKYCRPIFIQALFDPTISKKSTTIAYKAVIFLYDSEFGEQISISNLFNDLKDKDFENFSLQLLSKMNVDSIPIKNKYIFQLINSSHVDESASLILQKMMSNSQRNAKIASILLNNSKWLKFGLPTYSHTSMIFQSCVKFGNSSLINDARNCEELPFFFMQLLQSDNINDIQSIYSIMKEIEFDDLESLSEIDFFNSLYDIMLNTNANILPYIDLLSNIAKIQYSRDYKNFIKILKNFLTKDVKTFHESLKALANLSVYEKCAHLIQNQNIISIAKKRCQSQSDFKLLQKIKRNLN